MWREEYAEVDRTLEKITEALMDGDKERAYRAVIELLEWWGRKRNVTLDLSGDVREVLIKVARGEHPISEERILPGTTFKELVDKLLKLIEAG